MTRTGVLKRSGLCFATYSPYVTLGVCMPDRPINDAVAQQATSGKLWKVMPVVEPPFVYKTDDTNRPFSGFIIDLWEDIGDRAGLQTIWIDPGENSTYNSVFEDVVRNGWENVCLFLQFS